MCELRDIREEKGLKREYVADKLGISPDHLSAIERGSTPADLIKVKKLSIIYNVPFSLLAEKALNTIQRKWGSE